MTQPCGLSAVAHVMADLKCCQPLSINPSHPPKEAPNLRQLIDGCENCHRSRNYCQCVKYMGEDACCNACHHPT